MGELLGHAILRLMSAPAAERYFQSPLFVSEELLSEVEDAPVRACHCYGKRCVVQCEQGAFFDQCDGVHVNYARQFGYAALKPIADDSAKAK